VEILTPEVECGITCKERVKGKTIYDAVVRRNPSTLLMELQII
jgi:hypothetical protein